MIAFFLSFIVFIGLEYLMQQSQSKINNENKNITKTKQTTTLTKATPTVANINDNSTPSIMATPKMANSGNNKDINRQLIETTPIISTIKSDKFIIEIDNLGRIAQYTLLENKYKNDKNESLKLFDNTKVKPLEVRFSDPILNREAFSKYYTASVSKIDLKESAKIILTQRLSKTTITKIIKFYKDGHYDLDIKLSSNQNYFITTGYRPIADKSRFMIVKGALIKDNKNIINTIEDKKGEGNEQFSHATIVSAFDRYYSSVFYKFEKGMQVSLLKDNNNNPIIFIQGKQNINLNGYIGAKDYKILKSINPQLTDIIEYGWFTFLSKPFFAIIMWIHNLIGNWGWAIIFFTILVKLTLFPLSYKGMMSMQKLKDLAPKMKEIKERYGKDPQKMNMHMMELYRKHNANPMGGCLPMLLQIPVFFALYRVLLNAVELQGAEWIIWIDDLSKMDPFFILPILMGASMYLQQKITPSTITDPIQQKIFMYLPAIMTIFFITFPSGLVLYWLTNNILSITQQYYINNAYEKHKQEEIKAHHKH